MAMSKECVNLKDAIDGQIVRLTRCMKKLTKAKESIYEARDNRVANEEDFIEAAGQSIQEVSKDIADVGEKLCEYSQLMKADKPTYPYEDDSDSDVEFVPIAGPSTSSNVRFQRKKKSSIGRSKVNVAKADAAKPFECCFCHHKMNRIRNLKGHMVTHTGAGRFRCSKKNCGKTFGQKWCLKRHMVTHAKVKPFQCTTCKKGFSQKGNLDRHLFTHQKEKSFKCSKCPKQFGDSQRRFRHIEKQHKDTKLFECFMCKYQAAQIVTLERHMLIHSGEKQFECKICKKDFTSKSNLNRHMRTHTKEKPVSCEHCGKSFARSDSLNNHRLICRSRPLLK